MSLQQTISPIDGSIVAEVMLAAEREIEATLETAAQAQRRWKSAPLAERIAAIDDRGIDALAGRQRAVEHGGCDA